jgi:uncharacterized NAD-dependent epimerase/dehydratase family protein
MPKIIVLTEGKSNPADGKTATGILRYNSKDVVALLDSTCAGKTAQEAFGVGGDIPFISELKQAQADTLLIGIAPPGGVLPPSWGNIIREAIESGMDIISGLHYLLDDDEELHRLAQRHGVRIRDLRRVPEDLTVSKNMAKDLRCHRVHTVGHDCSVGKLVASIELWRALESRGYGAKFVATGQTGILIAGGGVPVDRVISDFVAGSIEEPILEHADEEFVVIEGQGSLVHPLYSGVTLSLLHGCAPQTMVLVFEPERKTLRSTSHPVPPLAAVIRIFEELASFITPSKVVALAANTASLSASKADEAMKRTEGELGLVTSDVIRHGPDRIVEAILQRHGELGLTRKTSGRTS